MRKLIRNEGGIAQLVERLLCKQEVLGSNPNVSKMIFYNIFDVKRFFVSDIISITKNKIDKNSHKIYMLKKIVTSNGLIDVMPTKYYKVFKTLTRKELSQIHKEFKKVE